MAGEIAEVLSASPSHYELVAIAQEIAKLRLGLADLRNDLLAWAGDFRAMRDVHQLTQMQLLQMRQVLEAIRPECTAWTERFTDMQGIFQAMLDNSLALQQEAETYLQNQTMHAESYIERLERPDYYPFVSLPQGTTATDLPDGGRQFVLPGGIIILVRTDHTVVVISDGRAINVDISLGDNVVLPNGQTYQVHGDWLVVTHAAAGIEGLPQDVQPICIGRGRYRAEFADGVVFTVWHALPADDVHPTQECMLHVANPTGGILVISRKGIQGIGVEVQVRLLADGALGFRVLPDGNPDAVQYLHAGTARPMQGIIELALSNGNTITYRCGRSPDDPDGGTGDGDGAGSGEEDNGNAPVIFQCEERGQCSI